jgi:hypothetical protein
VVVADEKNRVAFVQDALVGKGDRVARISERPHFRGELMHVAGERFHEV